MRSINAHFKLWGDSTKESLNDHLIEASKHDFDLPDCTCTKGLTFVGACGVGGCAKTQRSVQMNCTPVTCGNFTVCEDDPTCCSNPLPGICYRTPDDFRRPAPTSISGFTNTCSLGDRVFTFDCGPSSGFQLCQADAYNCAPKCRGGSPAPANSTQCPGYGTNMLDDGDMNFVTSSSLCPSSSGNHCSIYCNSGFHFDRNTFVCEPDIVCGNGYREIGEKCDKVEFCSGECRCYEGTQTPNDAANQCDILDNCASFHVNGSTSWGPFLTANSLWSAWEHEDHRFINQMVSFTAVLNAASPGTYTFRYSFDDNGYIAVNGVRVLGVGNNQGSYNDFTAHLNTGNNLINVKVVNVPNALAPTNEWKYNPGAFALEVYAPDGTLALSSTQIDAWKSSGNNRTCIGPKPPTPPPPTNAYNSWCHRGFPWLGAARFQPDPPGVWDLPGCGHGGILYAPGTILPLTVAGTTGTIECVSSPNPLTNAQCTITAPPPPPGVCGNKILEEGEDCDGKVLCGNDCKCLLGIPDGGGGCYEPRPDIGEGAG